MEIEKRNSRVTEQLAFTPFDIPKFRELKAWISRDTQTEIKTAFGPSVTDFASIKIPFVSTLAEHQSAPNAISMIVTIRTSYKTLINIGYIYITYKASRLIRSCYINCVYINKVFRKKDYEYRILKKLIDFLITELKSSFCFIWIYSCNYLFLSIARTLGFRLIRTLTDKTGKNIRYCYAITESNAAKVNSPERVRIPEMRIPDYLKLKSNLIKINIEQKIDRGSFKRKAGVVYSPMLELKPREFKNHFKQGYSRNHDKSSLRSPKAITKTLCNSERKNYRSAERNRFTLNVNKHSTKRRQYTKGQ